MIRPIPFQRPSFPPPEAIEGYFRLSRAAHRYSNFGPCSELLRERLASLAGRSCVTVANGTVGLMLAVAALRRRAAGEQVEALVPSFAFAASAQCAVWNGLRPVFVDIGAGHWHMSPAALEAALAQRGQRVAVVIALSAFGVPPPPEVRLQWQAICARHDVPLLIDSAAGCGARGADGVPIGAQGDAEVVSLDALKMVSAAEGGAVFCRDEALAATLTRLTHFAFDEHHQAQRPDGMNGKMSELAAAVALASLDNLPALQEALAAVVTGIEQRLPPGFLPQAEYRRSLCQFFPVAVPDGDTRDRILHLARERGIEVRAYYYPLHAMPAFASYDRADDLRETKSLCARMLSLPMALDFGEPEMCAIGDLLASGLGVQATRDGSPSA